MNNETVNRKYKDTVFRLLFKDKSNLLSLFNAVNDTDFSDENDIKITTLENAIYMTSKNDISCIIDMKLNLFEHQSTVNPNMPYRNLEYVTKCFKRYVGNFDIYTGKALTLPNPKFVVFYNGVNEQPPIRVMRLSDLYAHKDEIPNLELVVIQYNINNLADCTLMTDVNPLRNIQSLSDASEAISKQWIRERQWIQPLIIVSETVFLKIFSPITEMRSGQ